MIATVRARWLACASVGGAALGHLLDELGALPGVHEPRGVRLSLADPTRGPGLVLLLVATTLAGWLTARLLQRSAALAALALLSCQLLAATGLEAVARGRVEAVLLEPGGRGAIAVQLGVALVVVLAACLTALALRRVPSLVDGPSPTPLTRRRGSARGWHVVSVVPFQGRAPPCSARLLVP